MKYKDHGHHGGEIRAIEFLFQLQTDNASCIMGTFSDSSCLEDIFLV